MKITINTFGLADSDINNIIIALKTDSINYTINKVRNHTNSIYCSNFPSHKVLPLCNWISTKLKENGITTVQQPIKAYQS
jgi:hypothetical protein